MTDELDWDKYIIVYWTQEERSDFHSWAAAHSMTFHYHVEKNEWFCRHSSDKFESLSNFAKRMKKDKEVSDICIYTP